MANKALTLNRGRQNRLVAEQAFTFENLADTGVGVVAVKLPVGAVVIGGGVVVDTAFNTATSAVLDVGDATTANRYKDDVDLKTAGYTALVPTGYVSDGSDIVVTPALVGTAATAGAGRLVVEYYIQGRAQEVQPN